MNLIVSLNSRHKKKSLIATMENIMEVPKKKKK